MFDCASCDDVLKSERGHCPFVEQQTDGTEATIIDCTDTAHDTIYACPRGIQLREHFAQRDIELFHTIERLGGPSAYYPPPLSMRDTVTLETLTLLMAIKERFVYQVRQQRGRIQ